VKNFSFTPAQLTINAGDIVKWTNIGGFHNVVADDNSFTSGAVSSSAWVYEHTFNSVGSNPYYCAQHGGAGGSGMSGVIIVENATDVNDNGVNIFQFELLQNYPNPFNPTTKISWQSPVGGWQTLKVYDVLGNLVATLVEEYKPAGSYEVEFSAKGGFASDGNVSQLSSGVYFYKLSTGSFEQTKKMTLIK
jgi:hypothetical protein